MEQVLTMANLKLNLPYLRPALLQRVYIFQVEMFSRQIHLKLTLYEIIMVNLPQWLLKPKSDCPIGQPKCHNLKGGLLSFLAIFVISTKCARTGRFCFYTHEIIPFDMHTHICE